MEQASRDLAGTIPLQSVDKCVNRSGPVGRLPPAFAEAISTEGAGILRSQVDY